MRSPVGSLALVALAACVWLAGCWRSHDAASPSPLRLEVRRFEKALPGCGDKDKREEPCVTFSVAWPEVVGGVSQEVRTKINATLMARLQPSDAPRGFEAEAAALIDDYKRFRKEFPDSELGYFTRRGAEVSVSNASVLSVVIHEEDFRGGPHPSSERTYLNLRPASGDEIALDEIIDSGAAAQLRALVEQRFRRQREVPAGRKLADAGFHFDDDKFTLSKSWGIDPNGLVFHYNPYEVAPYALGPTTVTLGWGELSGLLRKEAGVEPARK